MEIVLVAAMAHNRCIGKDNQLLWHLPADFKFFKSLTVGHYLLMGRKTFESIGKVLPERTTLLVSRTPYPRQEGLVDFRTIDSALDYALQKGENTIYVVGGGQIYEQCLPIAHKMYLTHVEAAIEGDTFFPNFDQSQWVQKEVLVQPIDPKHSLGFRIVEYSKSM